VRLSETGSAAGRQVRCSGRVHGHGRNDRQPGHDLLCDPLARLEGIDVEHWKTDFASQFFKRYFDFTVAMLVWGLLGLMLAILTRSSAIATGSGIGFRLVVESLITIVAANAAKYLPGGTLSTLVRAAPTGSPGGAALGVVVLYGVIAATVSLIVFRTRDIVS
jgi:hypothetical protein